MDYLNELAEPESRRLPEGNWDRAVALPLYGEKEISPLLESLGKAARGSTLVIAVVNARLTSPDEVHGRNHRLVDSLLANPSGRLDIFVVDRSQEGAFFPEDQGVGLARKIGCDIALSLWKRGQLRSPMITTTDGDARVEPEYFEAVDRVDWRGDWAAGYFDYLHEIEDPEAFPLLLYEIWLRYYVQGLRYALSPYAFPTVGSTMAIHLTAYEKARGFPRRNAGEDFYLFNKLAKLGPIAPLRSRVHLRYRLSQRVPFGTGAGTIKLKRLLQEGRTLSLCPARVFEYLSYWLRALEGFPVHRDIDRLRKDIPKEVDHVLTQMKTWDALGNAARTRPEDRDCRRSLMEWFDGFRTLKFIHGLRDRFLPEVPFEAALRNAAFLERRDTPSQWLNQLRQNDDAVHFPALN